MSLSTENVPRNNGWMSTAFVQEEILSQSPQRGGGAYPGQPEHSMLEACILVGSPGLVLDLVRKPTQSLLQSDRIWVWMGFDEPSIPESNPAASLHSISRCIANWS